MARFFTKIERLWSQYSNWLFWFYLAVFGLLFASTVVLAAYTGSSVVASAIQFLSAPGPIITMMGLTVMYLTKKR